MAFNINMNLCDNSNSHDDGSKLGPVGALLLPAVQHQLVHGLGTVLHTTGGLVLSYIKEASAIQVFDRLVLESFREKSKHLTPTTTCLEHALFIKLTVYMT